MEVVGNLAAGIAHDLNNILSGVVSYPDILLREIPENDPWHAKIEIIKKSGQKAAVIVQDLLTLARRGVDINDICNINSVIRDYLDSVEYQRLQERYANILVQTNLDRSLMNIKGSPIHLSKAIMNILANGFEAMPAGGTLRIVTSNVYVDRELEGYESIPEGEYSCVSISDTGVGISRDDLKKIFEPFYTKKSMHMSGTGLGMTVVWGTVKDHGGFIDIKSSVGKGTTFTLYIPSTRDQETYQSRIVLDDYLGTETVLIVDDVPEQLEIARNMLEKLGYTTITANNGRKAVEIFKQQDFDLLILDMVMPGGMDGLETYQEIAKLKPRQKAIVTSGYSESERVQALRKLGVSRYVQKPYTMEVFGMAVRKELDS